MTILIWLTFHMEKRHLLKGNDLFQVDAFIVIINANLLLDLTGRVHHQQEEQEEQQRERNTNAVKSCLSPHIFCIKREEYNWIQLSKEPQRKVINTELFEEATSLFQDGPVLLNQQRHLFAISPLNCLKHTASSSHQRHCATITTDIYTKLVFHTVGML